MSSMEAKLDAIMHRMDKQNKKLHSAHETGAIERGGIRRGAEGSADEDPYAVEEANYLNEQRSYHFKPNPNLPTHYNQALRNHEKSKKAVSRNRRRRLKITPMQSHFHGGFRKQKRKNNFLNSWKFSRK